MGSNGRDSIGRMDDLTNKVALVTGGSRGIGRAIALDLARAGCHVAVGCRERRGNADEVTREVVSLGRKSRVFRYDVSDANEAKSLVQAVEQELGPIEILVNSAGINPAKPLQDLTNDDWDETIQTNLSSAFYVTQAVLAGLRARGWGRILFISSIAAQTGGVIGPHYAASKAGLIGLAHSYANLLAKEGITANVIAPALIETEMIANLDSIRSSLLPVGRFGKPEEVSSVAVALVSNGYITGQTINVNGGWYMS
jgi:3-oxoacyl-[acyl-carrier protein] reductase